ncbi:MAG: hypothetical protein V1731_02385 [Candidatus Aenigmatarchaeota archaeon]
MFEMQKIKKMSPRSLKMWAAGKFLVGIGLGALLAINFQGIDWNMYSVLSMILGILLVLKSHCAKK